MAHHPKPFYRNTHKAFYCQIGGKQLKLVSGPNDPATETLAWEPLLCPTGNQYKT